MDKVYLLNSHLSTIPFSEALFRGEMVFTSFVDREGLFLDLELSFNSLVKSAQVFWQLDSFQISRINNLLESSWNKFYSSQQNHYYRLSLVFEDDSFTLYFQIKPNDFTSVNKKLMIIQAHHWSEWSQNAKLSFYADRMVFKQKLCRPFNDYLRTSSTGDILEASASNIFFIKNNKLFSPLKENIYFGVSGQILEREFPIKFSKISVKEIQNFEGAFLVNQVRGIEWVDQIGEVHFTELVSKEKKKWETNFKELWS